MRRTLILGFVGATGAGKSALAKRLVRQNGFTHVHMGQPIKDMLASLGLTEEELHGSPSVRSAPSDRLSGRSPRYAMQTLGTGWGRSMISPTIWADALDRRLGFLIDAGVEKIVIDDLRFPEDFGVIVRRGGIIVSVIRPGVSPLLRRIDHVAHRHRWSRPFLTRIGFRPVHETEYHWHSAPVSFAISNDGTIEKAHADILARLK